jgi:preprotein translocase subunit SecG
MTSALFITQIVLAILIVIVVMLQKSSSIGLGAYSGSNESLFGAKGPAGFLTKATFILGLLFIVNTLYLGYLYSKESSKSAVDTISKVAPAPKSTSTAPAAPFKVEKKTTTKAEANSSTKTTTQNSTPKEANSTK